MDRFKPWLLPFETNYIPDGFFFGALRCVASWKQQPMIFLFIVEFICKSWYYYTGNSISHNYHSRESGNPEFAWMPDQVRHDIWYV